MSPLLKEELKLILDALNKGKLGKTKSKGLLESSLQDFAPSHSGLRCLRAICSFPASFSAFPPGEIKQENHLTNLA